MREVLHLVRSLAPAIAPELGLAATTESALDLSTSDTDVSCPLELSHIGFHCSVPLCQQQKDRECYLSTSLRYPIATPPSARLCRSTLLPIQQLLPLIGRQLKPIISNRRNRPRGLSWSTLPADSMMRGGRGSGCWGTTFSENRGGISCLPATVCLRAVNRRLLSALRTPQTSRSPPARGGSAFS